MGSKESKANKPVNFPASRSSSISSRLDYDTSTNDDTFTNDDTTTNDGTTNDATMHSMSTTSTKPNASASLDDN